MLDFQQLQSIYSTTLSELFSKFSYMFLADCERRDTGLTAKSSSWIESTCEAPASDSLAFLVPFYLLMTLETCWSRASVAYYEQYGYIVLSHALNRPLEQSNIEITNYFAIDSSRAAA